MAAIRKQFLDIDYEDLPSVNLGGQGGNAPSAGGGGGGAMGSEAHGGGPGDASECGRRFRRSDQGRTRAAYSLQPSIAMCRSYSRWASSSSSLAACIRESHSENS
jgi:hypothetical protein